MTNTKTQKTNNKQDLKGSLTTYFKGVKSEWGKVTWPEKKQIVFETGVVIFVVTAFTVSVYLMDIIFKGLLGLITK